MKRKLSFFQERLGSTLENKEDIEMTKFEGFLVDKIQKGQFDNHNCKKGRKRNYHQFFEKHLLKDFIVN